MVKNPACIVLAAGHSTRMGAQKLLLPLAGRPVVSYAVDAACGASCSPVLVVLGSDADRLSRALPADRRVQIILNPAFESGIASSLQAGLSHVPADSPGAVVTVADQPLLRAAHLQKIIDTAIEQPLAIVAAVYGTSRGSPVYFPRELFSELQRLTGDVGGRQLVRRYTDRVIFVPLEPAHVGFDLDQIQDYDWVRENLAALSAPDDD